MKKKMTMYDRLEKINWRELTDNYNEQKIVEEIDKFADNATERMFTFSWLTIQAEDYISPEFYNQQWKRFTREQKEEVFNGHSVVTDYYHMLDGSPAEEWSMYYGGLVENMQHWIMDLVFELEKCKKNDQISTVMYVNNINNFGNINSTHKHKSDGHQESI